MLPLRYLMGWPGVPYHIFDMGIQWWVSDLLAAPLESFAADVDHHSSLLALRNANSTEDEERRYYALSNVYEIP
jgi:hypothetical protein